MNNKQTDLARRQFLKTSGAMSAASTVGASWLMNLATMAEASAADAQDSYKALVCVFLYGGNDACNTVLPLDDASWARYDEVRSIPAGTVGTQADLRLPKDQLPRINATVGGNTVQYGLHPDLTKVANLYNQGKLAVVANLGTLVKAPMDRATYDQSGSQNLLPPKLRSHNDQQTEWQSARTNIETQGWGGRVTEPPAFAFASSGGSDKANAFRSVYLGDNPTFSFGDTLSPFGITDGGNGAVPLLRSTGGKIYNGVGTSHLVSLVKGLAGGTRTNLIEKDYIDLVTRALDSEGYLSSLIGSINPPAAPPNNYLASQLRMVARVIKGHSSRPGRQVFFVSIGGFDTHDNQMGQYGHNYLMQRLDSALDYFATALGSDLDKVTTFTASDFGRLLNSNGDGTDHAWGGHHFVMGGSQVKGGQVYGKMPSYARTGSGNGATYTDQQMTGDGAMIPVVSVSSYAATMGRWFGLSDIELKGIFPNLYSLGTSPTNVGFMV